MKKIVTFILLGILIMANGACKSNYEVTNMYHELNYTEEDFVNIKSGTLYDEVVSMYGEADDGWGILVYLLEDNIQLRIVFSVEGRVLLVEVNRGDEFKPCLQWVEREKRELNRTSSLRHSKSDFDFVKEGMLFGDVEKELGFDYTLIGNGFIIAKYLNEDFNWFIIACGQNDIVKSYTLEGAI